VVVNDVARDPALPTTRLAAAQVRFYAGVPLVDGKGRVLGSLCILHDALRGISAEELTLLGMMAQEVMAVVQADAAAAPLVRGARRRGTATIAAGRWRAARRAAGNRETS
jgi:GAF domain-containing protein